MNAQTSASFLRRGLRARPWSHWCSPKRSCRSSEAIRWPKRAETSRATSASSIIFDGAKSRGGKHTDQYTISIREHGELRGHRESTQHESQVTGLTAAE